MQIIADPTHLDAFADCAFVPTLGALHEGHLQLIQLAASTEHPVVVSVFVNPTQFAAGEDFEQYPRDLERDAGLAESAGAAAVFSPSVETVYPTGKEHVPPTLPAVATQPGLEDAHRPDHFSGVAQVVARLFDLVKPAVAVFGEKDYQQLKMIEALVAQANEHRKRWPGLDILRHPIVREDDGLAMSSRNIYLNEHARKQALGLNRALRSVAEIARPGSDIRRLEEQLRAILVRHHVEIDYAVIRDAQTLLPIDEFPENASDARSLIAARVGNVRLIDNL